MLKKALKHKHRITFLFRNAEWILELVAKEKKTHKTEPRENNQRSSWVNVSAQGTKLDSRPCSRRFLRMVQHRIMLKPCQYLEDRKRQVRPRYAEGGGRRRSHYDEVGQWVLVAQWLRRHTPLHKPAPVNSQCETRPELNLMVKFQLFQYQWDSLYSLLPVCVSYILFY